VISCREATELVSRSMDVRLPWRQRVALRLHLAMCSLCRAFAGQMRFLREACARYPGPGVSGSSGDDPRP